MTPDRAASVHARLLAYSKQHGHDFQEVLTRYGIERFLYRLSCTRARETLCLKGALLFALWFDVPHRPTRDADFLGSGPADQKSLEDLIRSACAVEVEDGMSYDAASIRTHEIREEARYGGWRVTLTGILGRARSPVQIDVGFGDAVTPGAQEAIYPTLLKDVPAAQLRVYPRETVIAEKVEAMASLGMANSRMKDYFDLLALAREGAVDADSLGEAIRTTFERRQTPIPESMLLGLQDEFGADRTKQLQWRAFLAKGRLDAPALGQVVSELRSFLEGPLRLARDKRARE